MLAEKPREERNVRGPFFLCPSLFEKCVQFSTALVKFLFNRLVTFKFGNSF